MSRKFAAILWAAKVLFIIAIIISLPIVLWYATDMRELVNYAFESVLAGEAWGFISRNSSSFFFLGFFFTVMFLILRHNQKRLRQDRAAVSETEEDDWLLERPFNYDPKYRNVPGNIYHSPDMWEK